MKSTEARGVGTGDRADGGSAMIRPGAFRSLYLATRNFHRDGCFDLAATVAYFSLLSLIPLSILLVAGGALLVGSVDAAERGTEVLLRDLLLHLGPNVFEQARQVGREAVRFGWPFLFLSLWTASKVFSEVEKGMDLVFQVPKRRSFPVRKLLAFGLIGLLVAVLLAVLLITSALSAFERFLDQTALSSAADNPLFIAANNVVSRYLLPWLLAMATFSFIYKVVPNRSIALGPACAAGALAGSVWELLKMVFTNYVGNVATYARTYGALEGVVVFAIWIQLSASLLLWGGELAAVLAVVRTGRDYRRPGTR